MKFTLLICTFGGCWEPPSWTLRAGRVAYRIYAMFLICSLNLFMISEFIYVVLNANSSDEFTDSLYMMLTILVAAYKQIYVWIDREAIAMLLKALTEKPFAPCEPREVMIREKFRRLIR
jgi:hypothetical protein